MWGEMRPAFDEATSRESHRVVSFGGDQETNDTLDSIDEEEPPTLGRVFSCSDEFGRREAGEMAAGGTHHHWDFAKSNDEGFRRSVVDGARYMSEKRCGVSEGSLSTLYWEEMSCTERGITSADSRLAKLETKKAESK